MIIDDYLDYTKAYKAKYGEKCIVLMQVGSFYEMYSIVDDTTQDIYAIADICNIQISRKNKSIVEVSLNNPLMAGFPLYTLRKFTNILLNNNYTIVLVEQVTEPPNPERKITEILSPGVNVNVANKKSNYMMVLYYEFADDLPIVGIAGIDISTGMSFVYEAGSTSKTDPEFTNDEVFRILATYSPCEIVILSDKKYDDSKKAYLMQNLNLNNVLTHYKWETYEYIRSMQKISYQNAILEKAYGNKKEPTMLSIAESINLEKYSMCRVALCCLLQFAYEHNMDIIKHLNIPDVINNQKHLSIEYNSAAQLNILGLYPNDRPLIDLLNRCHTAFGSRAFRDRLLKPLVDPDALNKRYDAIEYLLDGCKFQKVGKHLCYILDLERIKRKMTMGKFHPQDWCGFNASLENAVEILDAYYNHSNMSAYKDMIDFYSNILDLNEASKYNINDIKGNIFLRGIYGEIDQYSVDFNNAYQTIVAICDKINNILGEPNACKIEFTERDSYYLLLTKKRYDTAKAKDGKYMKDFKECKVSGSSSSVKIVNQDIIVASGIMDDKQAAMTKSVTECYHTFIKEFVDKYGSVIDDLIATIVEIDIACCNAKNAFEYRYYRPTICDRDDATGSYVKAENVRHPIVERIDDSLPYIGNDVYLHCSGMLTFGCNAVGKSTYMKSVGLAVVMAQAGMYVASSTFEYHPYRHVFTRISGMDNIYKGMSSFMVEMTELRNILQRCDQYSLVLGDEICSGTEATSAVAIVAAGIDALVKKRSSFIFATHLHQLPDIDIVKMHIPRHISVNHIHISIDENNRIVYERKLKDGRGLSTYGIEVCKSLDMPANFMKIAEGVRKEIEGHSMLLVNLEKSKYNKDVYIDRCSVCGQRQAQDTHHIKYQCESDDTGFFRDHHQNARHNLMPLCKDCHMREHSGEIDIKGYKMTSAGKMVDVDHNKEGLQQRDECGECADIEALSEEQISKVREYVRKGKLNWYMRSARTNTYKKCSDTRKVIDKINKILKSNIEDLDGCVNRLFDPSL
jgi:DNA mismatch repair protein MutS